jgi:hypothetical protein
MAVEDLNMAVDRQTGAIVTLDGAPSWKIDEGSVGSLTVFGSDAPEIGVLIPLPAGRCHRIARALGGACSANAVHMPTPLEISWRRPEALTENTFSHSTRTVHIRIQRVGYGLKVLIGLADSGHRLCFSGSLYGNRLTLGIGGNTISEDEPKTGLPCRLLLRVVGEGSSSSDAGIILREIEGLRFHASAGRIKLSGVRGMLVASGTEVHIAPSDDVRLVADSAPMLVDIDGSSGSLELGPTWASSIRIDGEERVQSRLARDEGLWFGLLAAVWTVAGGTIGLIAFAKR